MCNRYTLELKDRDDWLLEIIAEAEASLPEGMRLTARAAGDIHPTDIAPALVGEFRKPRGVGMRWGFRGEMGMVFNARAETALTKPMFQGAALDRRCLLPAAGYYEWNERKERYIFRPRGKGILYLAGLYRKAPDGINEFVILTREAYDEAREVHERMPLIITDPDRWLFDREAVPELLASGGSVRLAMECETPHQMSMFDD